MLSETVSRVLSRIIICLSVQTAYTGTSNTSPFLVEFLQSFKLYIHIPRNVYGPLDLHRAGFTSTMRYHIEA